MILLLVAPKIPHTNGDDLFTLIYILIIIFLSSQRVISIRFPHNITLRTEREVTILQDKLGDYKLLLHTIEAEVGSINHIL